MSSICRETGEVVARDKKGRVQVKIERVDACETCDAKGACKALGGGSPAIVISNAI